jgi:hypothetical protein
VTIEGNPSVNIPVHKFVLWNQSPVLKKMVQQGSTIVFPKASQEIINYVLEFLYTQLIEVPKDMLTEIKNVATALEMHALLHLINNLPVDDSSKKITFLHCLNHRIGNCNARAFRSI